ncbi:MAG TPA: cupin domain-containing protein [Actinomycetota bacterium]|nr:cupin domain-containing protein [Actinomycetota bacterium]
MHRDPDAARDVRLVVAGDDDRRSAIVRDAALEPVELASFPGAAFFHVWSGALDEPLADPGAPPRGRWIPASGAFRFGVSVLPPAYGAGAPLDLVEIDARLPGLAETLDLEEPGMHVTDTLDLVYVAAGEVTLVLDDAERRLRAGDCVVQRGNRHAWRNDGPDDCVLVITMLGFDPRPSMDPSA